MIVVIGGSGFIGTKLIGQLLKAGEQVVNIDKQMSNTFAEITEIADVTNIGQLRVKMRVADYVILLAAEHRDDVSPVSRYYDVNVDGTKNVLQVMDELGIKKIIFPSSVAVYGLNKPNPDEGSAVEPFNHYGKSKWQAEEVLREWYYKNAASKTLVILRPTVVFGPNNKGNVYTLLTQIVNGKFLMIGNGNNKKSMSYIDNIVGFFIYCIDEKFAGYHLYNYADKPDLTTKELLKTVELSLQKKLPSIKIPYFVGYAAGVFFDVAAKLTGKKFSISSVRIKKFCSTTEFSSEKVKKTGYIPALTLYEGIDTTVKEILNSNSKA